MVKSSVQATASLGVAGKATGGFEKKKKNLVQGRSWNGYCQFPALGHDLVLRS